MVIEIELIMDRVDRLDIVDIVYLIFLELLVLYLDICTYVVLLLLDLRILIAFQSILLIITSTEMRQCSL